MDGDLEIFCGDNEEEILGKFVNFFEKNKDAVFITYNGYGFDIPFIIVRSAVHKIKFKSLIQLNKYNMVNSNHFDTMMFFNQNGVFFNVRLDVIARSLGIPVMDGRFSGVEVERLFKEGKMDEIVKHCKEDVELTEKIYFWLKG